MGNGPRPEGLAYRKDKQRLALVLWNGNIGGAEVFSVALAHQMRQLGREVTIVFIQDPQPLAARLLDNENVPYRSLGFGHGRDVLRHPRRYAAQVADVGPDGALLVSCGFMGAALRAGGYRGPIVAVEHGDVLEAQFYSQRRRALRWIGRVSGAWADDVEVAVSDFVLKRLRRQPHTHAVKRIYNGIDPGQYKSEDLSSDRASNGDCVVAFAGRLVYGKGADHLIEAVAQLSSTQPIRLLIAGDGPERSRLVSLAHSLGISDTVEFLGLEHDMPVFWQMCDVAVIPSTEFTESCPMTTLEAMASGKPVVATRNGGLPELVIEGKTGIVVPPHDKIALAEALALYADDEELRMAHGASGRAHVMEHFNINKCARAYLELFDELAGN
ncbi:MAG TPA: glycosyltransferase family 4 protein [Solirubrobacteraceae bacterium]|jgi:glycosyltransferase involved in cell wall biosynthesis|nr:glycosyltransferase family 4 protein [Solirubrobacteraceae bacterium]